MMCPAKLKRVYFEAKQLKINLSFYKFLTESLVMRTSAKNTFYSDALILILELLSQVKSDCHENLPGASVCGDV